MLFAATFELLEQEVADRRPVDDRAVERLVREVEHAPAVGAEPPPERDAVRILRRRRVERARGRRLPVHDDLLQLLVVHPAAAEVDRSRELLEVEPSEHEAALGVLERLQPPRRPRVHRRLGDLAVDGVGRPGDDRPHAFEVHVRAVDVLLLRLELRVRHACKSGGPPRGGGDVEFV